MVCHSAWQDVVFKIDDKLARYYDDEAMVYIPEPADADNDGEMSIYIAGADHFLTRINRIFAPVEAEKINEKPYTLKIKGQTVADRKQALFDLFQGWGVQVSADSKRLLLSSYDPPHVTPEMDAEHEAWLQYEQHGGNSSDDTLDPAIMGAMDATLPA